MTVGVVVGAGGIGSEVARLAGRSVDHLVVFDRDEQRISEIGSELGCTGLAGDITSAADRQELVGKIRGFGLPLRWLVLTSGAALRAPVAEVPLDTIQAVVDTNVVGPMALISQLLRSVSWAPGARVVGIGSIS